MVRQAHHDTKRPVVQTGLLFYGWGGWIRTNAWWSQSPLHNPIARARRGPESLKFRSAAKPLHCGKAAAFDPTMRVGCNSNVTASQIKTASDWRPFHLAGAAGFEPTHGGVKVHCLTAWLRPIVRRTTISRCEIASCPRAADRDETTRPGQPAYYTATPGAAIPQKQRSPERWPAYKRRALP